MKIPNQAAVMPTKFQFAFIIAKSSNKREVRNKIRKALDVSDSRFYEILNAGQEKRLLIDVVALQRAAKELNMSLSEIVTPLSD